jgi:hypothetical protein
MSWKKRLHSGDEIRIDYGDNEIAPTIIIAEIEYLLNEEVKIIDRNGEKHQCTLEQIS